MSKEMRFVVNANGHSWNITCEDCPLNFNDVLVADAHAFVRGTLHKKLVELAKLPQYTRVVALEQRRVQAEREIEGLNAAIRTAKDACISDTVADARTIADATDRIAECERGIAAAKLVIESVDRILPEATEARSKIVRERARELMRQERERLMEDFRTASEKAWKHWKDAIVELLRLDVFIDRAQAWKTSTWTCRRLNLFRRRDNRRAWTRGTQRNFLMEKAKWNI